MSTLLNALAQARDDREKLAMQERAPTPRTGDSYFPNHAPIPDDQSLLAHGRATVPNAGGPGRPAGALHWTYLAVLVTVAVGSYYLGQRFSQTAGLIAPSKDPQDTRSAAHPIDGDAERAARELLRQQMGTLAARNPSLEEKQRALGQAGEVPPVRRAGDNIKLSAPETADGQTLAQAVEEKAELARMLAARERELALSTTKDNNLVRRVALLERQLSQGRGPTESPGWETYPPLVLKIDPRWRATAKSLRKKMADGYRPYNGV